MRTENDFLLELVDLIFSSGIDESLCSFIHKETSLTHNGNSEPLLPMSEGAISICNDIYCMCIGEIAMGYRITPKDNEDMVDDITNYILMCQRG